MLLATLLWQWVRRRLLAIEVAGNSMQPTLAPGDVLLCATGHAFARGAIVVLLRHEGGLGASYLIKRVVALPGEERAGTLVPPGHVWLEGDAAGESLDSRRLGPLPIGDLRAIALARLRGAKLTDMRFVENRR